MINSGLTVEEKLSRVGLGIATKTFDKKFYTETRDASDKDDIDKLLEAKKQIEEGQKEIQQALSWGKCLVNKYNVDQYIYALKQKAKIQGIDRISEKLDALSQDASIVNSKPLSNEELLRADIDTLLDEKTGQYVLSRQVLEFWNDPEVKATYRNELENRKAGFLILQEGYKHLPKVLTIDSMIEALENKEYEIRINAYVQGMKDISTSQELLIRDIRFRIAQLEAKKEQLLQGYELSVVYEAETLLHEKQQFETTGFIMNESRKNIFKELLDDLLHGHSILLTGGTGTGKTVLAIKASQKIQTYLRQAEIVDSSKLQKQLESVAELDGKIDSLISKIDKGDELLQATIYGSKSISNNDLLINLGFDPKLSELGKLFKHWRENTMPIISGLSSEAEEAIMKLAGIFTYRISSKKLSEEIKDTDKIKKVLETMRIRFINNDPDIVEVVAGNSNLTIGEILAKVGLRGDGKGATETYTELGKLLKAWRDGKIFIFDEIDMTTNDLLMGLKYSFTWKKGQKIVPQQGDMSLNVPLKTATTIGTANLRSAKHPDREDMDAAFTRIFRGIDVPYFVKNEQVRFVKVLLMNDSGVIPGIPSTVLDGPDSFIAGLIDATIEIQKANYGSLELLVGNKKMTLKKAILDTGNFRKMLEFYGVDDGPFIPYFKKQLIRFATNSQFPKGDRQILMQILSRHHVLSYDDIPTLEKRNTDMSYEEIRKNFLGSKLEIENQQIKYYDKSIAFDVLVGRVTHFEPQKFMKEDGSAKMSSEEIAQKRTSTDLRNMLKDIEKNMSLDPHANVGFGFTDLFQLATADPYGALNLEQKTFTSPVRQFTEHSYAILESFNSEEMQKNNYHDELKTLLVKMNDSVVKLGKVIVDAKDAGRLLFLLQRTGNEEYIDVLLSIYTIAKGKGHFEYLVTEYDAKVAEMNGLIEKIDANVLSNQFSEAVMDIEKLLELQPDNELLREKEKDIKQKYCVTLRATIESNLQEKKFTDAQYNCGVLEEMQVDGSEIASFKERISTGVMAHISGLEKQFNTVLLDNNYAGAEKIINDITVLDSSHTIIAELKRRLTDASVGAIDLYKEQYKNEIGNKSFDEAKEFLSKILSLDPNDIFGKMEMKDLPKKKFFFYKNVVHEAKANNDFVKAAEYCRLALEIKEDESLKAMIDEIYYSKNLFELRDSIENGSYLRAKELYDSLVIRHADDEAIIQAGKELEVLIPERCKTLHTKITIAIQNLNYQQARIDLDEVDMLDKDYGPLGRGEGGEREKIQMALDGQPGVAVFEKIMREINPQSLVNDNIEEVTCLTENKIGNILKFNIKASHFAFEKKDFDKEVDTQGYEYYELALHGLDEIRDHLTGKKVLVCKDSDGSIVLQITESEGVREILEEKGLKGMFKRARKFFS